MVGLDIITNLNLFLTGFPLTWQVRD